MTASRNLFWMSMILFFTLIFLSNIVNCAEAADAASADSSSTSTKLKQASSSKISLIIINEDDWEQMLQGEWMVQFHAPWCPACRSMQSDWKSFSSWSSDLGIKVGSVDVTANPGLSGRFMVTALPTIYHVKDGVFRQYKGTRDTNTFVSFIEEKKWQSIEPVSLWKAPNSIPMSIVSNFFKISMALRAIHNSLVEDYGIPYWGSYIIFAFATILCGAILGLMIVCIIDIIFPAKTTTEEILKRPAAQSDIIDDTMDQVKDKNKDDDEDDTEEEDLEFDEEEEEEGDEEDYNEEDEDDGPTIEEVIDDEELLGDKKSPKQGNVRLRKARRD